MGGGPSSSGNTTTTSQLYSWRDLLPPWTQAGQRAALPKLWERFVYGGLTPAQEEVLSGNARSQVEDAASTARKNLTGRMTNQGINMDSPLAFQGYSDIESDRMASMQRAANELQKMKISAQDTATQQLLTSLYTAPPAAVGTSSIGTQSQSGGK